MIGPLIQGLSVTLRYFLRRPITMKYPWERWTPYPRWRGLHRLELDEEGRVKCEACFLCVTVCPANAIRVEAAEDEQHRKYPSVFEVNLARCIFCGFCEEACPRGALRLTERFELADYTRESLLYQKEELKG